MQTEYCMQRTANLARVAPAYDTEDTTSGRACAANPNGIDVQGLSVLLPFMERGLLIGRAGQS